MAVFRVWFAVFFVAIGGVLAGYYNSSVSGLLEMRGFQNNFPSIFKNESYNDTDNGCSSGDVENDEILVGLFIAIGNLGSMFGSIMAGKLADILSRRLVLSLSGFILMLGATIMAASCYNLLWMLFIGRTVTGISIGVFFVMMPIYIGEMAPKHRRGLMMSMLGPGFAVGVFIGLLSNVGFTRFDEGWRVTCGVLAMGGLIYGTGFAWIPYTPRWLVMKNRVVEAYSIFSMINQNSKNGNDCIVLFDFLSLTELNKKDTKLLISWSLKWKYLQRLVVMIVMFLLAAQMVIFISFYPVTFFCLVGVSQPFIVSIVLGPLNIVASILSTTFIDKVGRKLSLIGSGAVGAAVSLAMGLLLHIFSSDNTIVNYVVVVLICIYSFCMFYSWEVVPWIVVGESFPLNVKGIATSISNCLYWIFAFAFNLITPRLLGPPLHLHGFLYLTAVVNILGTLLVILAIPETKGISLESIDEVFSQSWMKQILCGSSKLNKGKDLPQVSQAPNPLYNVKSSVNN